MEGAHKLTPPDILVVSQILSEVQIIHESEDEGQRVLGGGVYSDKRHDVPILETTASQCLFIEPLWIGPQPMGDLQVGAIHQVCRQVV